MRIINPYHNLRHDWLKGQLHVHTTGGDSALDHGGIAQEYGRRGYDFIAFTDYNTASAEMPEPPVPGMVIIPGQEYRCRNRSELGIVGLADTIEADLQPREAILRADAAGAFVALNHPAWHLNHWRIEEMLGLEGVHGVEVYNAHGEELPGFAECTNSWDIMLTCGMRVFGTATDDTHTMSDIGRAWVMVNTEPTVEHILAALRTGRFYASSGVEVDEIWLTDDELMVQALDAQEIRFIAERGTVCKRTSGPVGRYRVQEEDVYVRVEIYGRGSSKAWLQPVFVDTPAARGSASAFRVWYLFDRARNAGQ